MIEKIIVEKNEISDLCIENKEGSNGFPPLPKQNYSIKLEDKKRELYAPQIWD